MSLIDTYGRLHDNLRISLTDRCNIRCFYCMPEDGVRFGPKEEVLTFEEIDRFVRIAVSLGVNKLRLTGGEPLLRKGLPSLVGRLAAIPGIRDIGLTTNGVTLAQEAAALWGAGLRRLNVHLDTLDRRRFLEITRRDDFDKVMAGIEAALSLGFELKINAVALHGITEPDVIPLAEYGRRNGIEVRFIEYMPLDAQNLWNQSKVLTMDTMLDLLRGQFGALEAIPDQDPRAPATEFRFADGVGKVGFIASVTKPFCLNCNRIRLTADGHLRYCLFAIEETNVKALLRGGASDEVIGETVRQTVRQKWMGHQIGSQQFVPPPRPMYSIGG